MSRAELLRRGAIGAAAPALLGAVSPMATALAAETAHPIPGTSFRGGRKGGTGRAVWPDASVVYDPPLALDLGGYYGLANFYRGLMYFGPDATPQLDMASSMDVSHGGRRYQFKLKPGLTFHNGREVTAADFKWTYERSSSKKLASWVQAFLASVHGQPAFAAGHAKHIAGLRVAGKYELILELDHPDVTVPGVLGIPPFYVVPKEEVERLGAQFTFNPVGTGPYKLDKYDKGNNMYTASRFDGYEYAGKLPYFDSLDWRWAIPEDLEYLRVKAGDADATGGNLNNALSVVAQLESVA